MKRRWPLPVQREATGITPGVDWTFGALTPETHKKWSVFEQKIAIVNRFQYYSGSFFYSVSLTDTTMSQRVVNSS